jgi:hypothetical protein
MFLTMGEGPAHCIGNFHSGLQRHLDSAAADPRRRSFRVTQGFLFARVSLFLAHDPEIVSTF